MPDLSSIAALDVVIGLAFVYFVLSIVCSAVNEAIAGLLSWRAKNLQQGLRKLLADERLLDGFLGNPRVERLFKDPGPLARVPLLGRWLGPRPPSYIPARVFALSFLDTVAPATGRAESAQLTTRVEQALKSTVLPERVSALLRDALDEAGENADRLKEALERSFDEVMDRASGWYKRRVQVAVLAIALLVTGAANIDSFAIGERLWRDDAVRAAVVAQAGREGAAATCEAAGEEADPVARAAACVGQIKELGLPIGWSDATTPDSTGQALGKALGLLITAFALTLGAPFWFDALGKLARLRATGNREGTAKNERAAEDRDDSSGRRTG